MLVYVFVYISRQIPIEKYSFMDEKEKEPCRSWSQPPRCVQWARHAVLHTQLRPRDPSPCLTSAELGSPEGSSALSGSPATKAWEREWGDRDQKDWNSSSLFALTTRFELQLDIISHFQKKARAVSRSAELSAACDVRMLGQKDTPQNKNMERRPGSTHPPA